MKEVLLKPLVLAVFDLKKEMRLEVDALLKNGLGFSLSQKYEDEWRLICAGSRFLSDTEMLHLLFGMV